MSMVLRISLFIGAAFTLIFFLMRIRKNRLRIQDTIFWTFFSFVLVLFSLFPGIVAFISKILGFQAASNFIFAIFIFVLIIKQFLDTVKISLLEEKVRALAQKIALEEKEMDDKNKE